MASDTKNCGAASSQDGEAKTSPNQNWVDGVIFCMENQLRIPKRWPKHLTIEEEWRLVKAASNNGYKLCHDDGVDFKHILLDVGMIACAFVAGWFIRAGRSN